MSNFFSIRSYVPEDKNFVISTFLRGLYYGNTFYNMIEKDAFMAEYKKVVEALLVSPNVVISVACLPDEPSVILGYVIMARNSGTIHWSFVKSVWRNKGIFKALLPPKMDTFTHFTDLGLKLQKQKAPNMVFNPFKFA